MVRHLPPAVLDKLYSLDWQTGPISVACSGGQVKCEMLPQVSASYVTESAIINHFCAS